MKQNAFPLISFYTEALSISIYRKIAIVFTVTKFQAKIFSFNQFVDQKNLLGRKPSDESPKIRFHNLSIPLFQCIEKQFPIGEMQTNYWRVALIA